MSGKNLKLTLKQRRALEDLKQQLKEAGYPLVDLMVFGSVARGEAEEGSDLDVLAITGKHLGHRVKHDIYARVTDINLKHDTNLSILIVDQPSWEKGLFSVLAIKDEVLRDGVSF